MPKKCNINCSNIPCHFKDEISQMQRSCKTFILKEGTILNSLIRNIYDKFKHSIMESRSSTVRFFLEFYSIHCVLGLWKFNLLWLVGHGLYLSIVFGPLFYFLFLSFYLFFHATCLTNPIDLEQIFVVKYFISPLNHINPISGKKVMIKILKAARLLKIQARLALSPLGEARIPIKNGVPDASQTNQARTLGIPRLVSQYKNEKNPMFLISLFSFQ